MKTLAAILLLNLLPTAPAANAEFRAGTAVVDVTPERFPVLVSGGFFSRSADSAQTPLKARAIVLDDGRERLAIVVVDNLMMPRPLLDEAKQLAAKRTRIRADRMLVAATHTHSAPSAMGCLGTDADPRYVTFLRDKLVEALVAAEANLEPARVGWATANAAEYTAVRRWILRPDRVGKDPFGNPTVRANMHAARDWDDAVGPSGPEDPELSLISIQTRDGRPMAVLANFSMHYFGESQPLSADYFGLFSEGLRNRLAKGEPADRSPFVGIMSHGCSGDIWCRDYMIPESEAGSGPTIETYTRGLLEIALSAHAAITYRDDVDLAMSEARMELRYRVPDSERLEWARRVVDEMGERLPSTLQEVYAREQILLHERRSAEIVVQALRIGDIAVAAVPTETYALTGLKLKLRSPLERTMVIELANGADGYVPPPEQHLLGGYNTWPARSAGLEISAEPKIVEAALQLLENVAGRPRNDYRQSRGPAAEDLLRANPAAYWRLDEPTGPRALDASGHDRDAFYEPGVVFFLDGPRPDVFCAGGEANRAAHFAGGRLEARLARLGDGYSVSLWFWNGMPLEGREIAGWMFSRGHDRGLGPDGDHVGLGGTVHPGRIVFLHGSPEESTRLAAGRTEIPRWTWSHVVFVRHGPDVRIYLNGNREPEIEVRLPEGSTKAPARWFFGGRSDNQSNWEGRLDEIAVFDRPLSPEEVVRLYPVR